MKPKVINTSLDVYMPFNDFICDMFVSLLRICFYPVTWLEGLKIDNYGLTYQEILSPPAVQFSYIWKKTSQNGFPKKTNIFHENNLGVELMQWRKYLW